MQNNNQKKIDAFAFCLEDFVNELEGFTDTPARERVLDACAELANELETLYRWEKKNA